MPDVRVPPVMLTRTCWMPVRSNFQVRVVLSVQVGDCSSASVSTRIRSTLFQAGEATDGGSVVTWMVPATDV